MAHGSRSSAELRPASASMAAARPLSAAGLQDAATMAYDVARSFPSSSISAPASRSISGGGRPPLPSVAPPAKKRALFVAPHRQESAAPPPVVEVPRRQESAPHGSGLPRQLLNNNVDGDFSSTGDGNASSAFFDWSLSTDYAAEDARLPSSQPFMNLLTQDKDADLQILMPEDATPSKRPPKRGSNYSVEEDIQVCKSWINISNDAVVGTDQPGATYWERIAQDFHKNKNFESDRSANSIEHRCQTILKECMRFHGYFEEIERCHPSGVPYQEHLLQAQKLYGTKNKGKRCPFIDCWLVVRHTEKFSALQDLNKLKNKRSSKSSNLNLNLLAGSEGDEGVQDTMQAQESSSKKPRPMGRKQSKEKLKRGEGDDDDEYKELMKSLIDMKAKEMKQKEEVNQRKMELEERRLQWKQEEKIMFCDVSKLDEHSKAYHCSLGDS
ncbi:hypothetical protein EJB05_27791, partial [Eragrostis curvula]